MPEIVYKNLLGTNANEDTAQNGLLAGIVAIDLFGKGGGTSTLSPHRPGIYQPSQRMVAETEAAAPNNITDSIEWIYPFNGKTYGLSNGSRFYEASTALGGTWSLKFATSASTGGGGLLPFGSNMYYGQNAVLGKFDGTNSNHNFQTFNSSTAGPRPMAIIAARLCVGNQRNIATLDSDETTFNATRIQLPTGYVIRSMEVWNNFLAIAADFTPPSASNPISSRLFLWNGTSTTYNDTVEIPFTSAPLLIANNNILWLIGGDTSSNMLIYAYNGAQLQEAFFIPDVVPHGIGSKTKFQGSILFGTNGRTNSNNGGVWTIGSGENPSQFGAYLSLLLSPSAGITGINCAGLYGEANNVLAAWYDGADYGVDKSSSTVFPNSGAYIQTLPLYMGEPTKNKQFRSIDVDLQNPGTATGATFQVQYRIDLVSAWTSLRTIAASDANINPTMPIGKTGRRIEFKFNWATSASNNPLRLRSFKVEYDVMND